MKLLIVDDSIIMRQAIEKYLGKYKLEVVGTAGDGKTALEIFERTNPDLVTMDITMPKMDGLTCLDRMLKIKPDTRILVISALKDPATGMRALRLGAHSFLTKPFTAEQLHEEIEIICRELL